jgi:hypothetical protein
MNRILGTAAAATSLALVFTGVSVTAASAATSTGTVKGHVRDIDGHRLKGITVALWHGGSLVAKDTTDSKGYFTVKARGNSYVVKFSDPDKDYVAEQSGSFTLKRGASRVVNGELDDAAAITGTVLSDNGTRVNDLDVTATGAAGTFTTSTNRSGNYYLKGLPAGSYSLEYSDDDHDRYLTEYYLDAATPAAATAITVDAGEKRRGVVERVTHGASIEGTVLVNGVLADPDLGAVVATLTDASGHTVATETVTSTFKFPLLPAGDYTVSFGSDSASGVVASKAYPDVITVGADDKAMLANVMLETKPDAVLPTIVDAKVSPTTVKYGKSFTVSASVKSYGDVLTGAVSLRHHSRIAETVTVGDNAHVTFRVSSKDWTNAKGTRSYSIGLQYKGTAATAASSDLVKVRIK